MLLYISSEDSLNTKFIAADGAVWYTIETQKQPGDQMTDIVRHFPETKSVVRILWMQKIVTKKLGDRELSGEELLRRKGAVTG